MFNTCHGLQHLFVFLFTCLTSHGPLVLRLSAEGIVGGWCTRSMPVLRYSSTCQDSSACALGSATPSAHSIVWRMCLCLCPANSISSPNCGILQIKHHPCLLQILIKLILRCCLNNRFLKLEQRNRKHTVSYSSQALMSILILRNIFFNLHHRNVKREMSHTGRQTILKNTFSIMSALGTDMVINHTHKRLVAGPNCLCRA